MNSIQSASNTNIPILTTAAVLVTIGIATVFRASSYDKKKKETSSSDSNSVTLTLPPWLIKELPAMSNMVYATDEDRMSLAIEISKRNVLEGTGGPFGCVIFKKNLKTDEYELVSAGINRVVPLNNSTLHGEMVAIQLAQKFVGSYTLNGDGEKSCQYELYTSCEPCAMCLGASLWSGVSRVVCGATKDDACAIGFDEGPVFEESYQHLMNAGIDVRRCVMRKEAADVLQLYHKSGSDIYNR